MILDVLWKNMKPLNTGAPERLVWHTKNSGSSISSCSIQVSFALCLAGSSPKYGKPWKTRFRLKLLEATAFNLRFCSSKRRTKSLSSKLICWRSSRRASGNQTCWKLIPERPVPVRCIFHRISPSFLPSLWSKPVTTTLSCGKTSRPSISCRL